MTIHQKLKACGVETSHHEGDLYARITPASEAIVASYEYRANVSKFTADDGSGQWFEIPFAFEPDLHPTITRADYFASYQEVTDWQPVQRAAHVAYYRQYVTDAMRAAVIERFGIGRLAAGLATDRHLNAGFRLSEWDLLAVQACSSRTLATALRDNGDGLTLSSQVCIIKQAACMAVEETRPTLRVSWYDRLNNGGGQHLTRDTEEARQMHVDKLARGFEVDPITVYTPEV